MILSDTAVRRPVFTTMILASLVLFGWLSFQRLGVDLFPRVEFPIITVLTYLPGADPETVERRVTDPIEESLSTISGLKHLRSTSAEGVSQIIAEFELEKDIDVAYQEITAKLGALRKDLPQDVEGPIAEKFDVDSAPILAVIVSAPLPIQKLTYLAKRVVKERLQRIPQVGNIKLIGGRERTIWVYLHPQKLQAHHLSWQEVVQALHKAHLETPVGRLQRDWEERPIKVKGEFPNPQDLLQLVLRQDGLSTVQLADVGYVLDGVEEERSYASLKGKPAIALLVRRQSGANTVAVAEAVKEEVAKLAQELAPQGVELKVAKDLSTYIRQSVEEVHFHLLYGGLLAILVVFLFLRNVRSTFISSLVLPTSVLGTFFAMSLLGLSQNLMTLLGLTLAIGLLIDDAIVVQENIMRHVEEGKRARQAALEGTREIGLAVFATTLAVVAVFLPIAFTQGLIGRFFYHFGVTVSAAVLISMFISFTLDPMLSARILRPPRRGKLYQIGEGILQTLEKGYTPLLDFALARPFIVVGLSFCLLGATLYATQHLRKEFLPLEDQSEFQVRVKAPLGANLAYTRSVLQRIEAELLRQPWVEYTFVTVGADELGKVHEGEMYVKMTPKEKRPITQEEAMKWLRKRLQNLHGAKISVEIVPRVSGGGFRGTDLQIELRGPNLAVLEKYAKILVAKLEQIPGFSDLDTNYEEGKPEVWLHPLRKKLSFHHISLALLSGELYSAFAGKEAALFRAQGERYSITVRTPEKTRQHLAQLRSLWIMSPNGHIPLTDVANVQSATSPVQINHYNRQRQITIYANLDRKKQVLGDALAAIRHILEEEHPLPAGFSYGFAGRSSLMEESFENLSLALLLAICIIYMVLASLFESFLHPFTIMISLPFSLVGALGTLLLFHMTLNIFTFIGLILLMGLVTKNGILLIDHANQLRTRGIGTHEALRRAGHVRLRPILMTTFAMIFGMLPVALGTGAGAESRAPMAATIIGGLITSTLLTLVAIPSVYLLLEKLIQLLYRKSSEPNPST